MDGEARPGPTAVETLAAFAIEQRDFAPEVLREGKRVILDQLACQVAAAPLPWSRGYRDTVLSFGTGDAASSVYYGDRLPLDQAVFLNGAFGQGAELDDTHLRSSTHSGAVIVPVALALAENRRLTGRQVLETVIVGIEVMIRIATAAAPHLHRRGHHVPPAVGPFGAAAAASRLMGLDEATTVQAMAIAGSHSAGLLEFTHVGGSVKRCHCGIAAMAGLRSAVLAAHGITGPRTILEGQRGFLATFAGDYDLGLLTRDLGAEYIFREMGYKPITSAFPAHAPLEALGWLQREHGLAVEEIAAIEIGMSQHSVDHVGVIRAPRDITDAHYSVAYGCAVRLLRGGNGFWDYREEDLADPRFLDIVRRVSVGVDPIAEEERLRLNNRGAVVTVTTADGRRLTKRIQYSKGHPRNPLSDDELTAKFVATVAPRLGEERTGRIVDRVWAIETVEDAGELVRLTFAPG